MTRLRSSIAAVGAALLLVVLPACSDVAGPAAAATVNGVEISDDELRDDLRTLADNEEFALGLTQVPVHADGSAPENRVDADFAAAVLELKIILELIDAEFEDRGLELGEEQLQTVRDGFGPELQAYLDQLPEEYVDGFVRWNAQITALRDDLAAEQGEDAGAVTDDDVRSFYDENLTQFEDQVCASHVLLETEAEADEVLADLQAGGDIAAIAGERSIDPSAAGNGGDLGCTSADNYVEEFAEAVRTGEIGEYLGPVETDFGFHVILVRSRGTTPFEEAEADIRTQLEGEAANAPAQAFGELLERLVAEAEVTVSSRYGEWNAEEGRVIPPEAPEGETPTLGIG